MTARAAPPSLTLRAKLFRGLADPSRLAILDPLGAGPLAVGEIVEATGLSQPNTSNHLACLLECGLVTREPRGRCAIYTFADHHVAGVLTLVDEVIAAAALGLAACPRYTAPGQASSSRQAPHP